MKCFKLFVFSGILIGVFLVGGLGCRSTHVDYVPQSKLPVGSVFEKGDLYVPAQALKVWTIEETEINEFEHIYFDFPGEPMVEWSTTPENVTKIRVSFAGYQPADVEDLFSRKSWDIQSNSVEINIPKSTEVCEHVLANNAIFLATLPGSRGRACITKVQVIYPQDEPVDVKPHFIYVNGSRVR